jgi:hypothetical protein
MAYQSTKPLANDKLSTSQGDIAGNFTEINTYVNVDHEAFNIANQGKHKRVFFTQQAADPATGATEAALYTKDSVVPGTAGLFYRPPNSGTPIELTYALKATPGYTILPSGIWMAWGTGVAAGGIGAITFAHLPGLQFPTACVSALITNVGNANSVWINTVLAATGFGIGTYPANATNVNYLAIGY